MKLFTALLPALPGPRIWGEEVFLRTPIMNDFDEWQSLRLASSAFLRPWEAEWNDDDHTRSSFRRRLRHYRALQDADQLCPFFIFRKSDNALVGNVMLNHVRRGIADTATLGYWMGERFAGQGLMTDALNTLAIWAFESLELHRLEAACLPANTASKKLLLRCGFVQEGYARSYLKIAGKWEDHLLFARLNPRHSLFPPQTI